jgi:hypothetical protein
MPSTFSCVHGLRRHAAGDFFAADDEEPVGGAVNGVEAIDRCQIVVIGQHQEVIAVLAIPPHHFVRRAVPVAVEGVGVSVALVPAQR